MKRQLRRNCLLTDRLRVSGVAKLKHPGRMHSDRGVLNLSLVVQLQSKLDLSRIEWFVTRRSNLAEVRVSVVPRTADGHDAVAAEVRSVEVRVVEDVEELCAELG